MYRLLLGILILVLASCTPTTPVDKVLDTAERIMDQRPDSALMLLRSISKDDLRSSRLHALYGLLMTQALDKNYVDVTSDSLITPAVDYYADSSDRLRLMKSLYYLAGVEYYRKAYSESLIASLKAYELACELDDKFWIGLTARRISDIYRDNYCAKEQMEFARTALENFRQTDRTVFIHYGIYDLASAYHANEDYNTTREICKELLDTAVLYNDNNLKKHVLELFGLASIALKDIPSAYNSYREIISIPNATVKDTAYYAVMCLRMGKNRDVIDILPDLFNREELKDLHKHWLKYNYYMALDSIKEAFKMKSALNAESDKTLRDLRRQNIAGAVMEHHQYRAEIDRANLKLSRAYTVIILALASCVIFALISYWRRRNLQQQKLVDEYVAMVNDFKLLLSQAEPTIEESVAETKSGEVDPERVIPSLDLLENFINEFDILCKNFRREDTPDNRQSIADSVEHLIDSFSSDSAWLNELERYANIRYENIMSKLRTDFPNLKDIDYMIFLLSHLGFSIPTVTLILKQKNKTVIYNRRKRLKEKFRTYDGPNREMYLDVMP